MKRREILEACWSGYQQRGMKKKGDRQVPNCVKMTEQELEEDLKKWFKEKWVRFGPDGKIRGECGGRDDSEGKPKCLPASKAHALGKKGRASSAAKKRREDPNPERQGPARNVATKTRGMKEQGIPELQPPPEQQQPSSYESCIPVSEFLSQMSLQIEISEISEYMMAIAMTYDDATTEIGREMCDSSQHGKCRMRS